jgi:hypothetical protein
VGTDDEFFNLKWVYRLRGPIPTAHEVIEIDGDKLFFPRERAAGLAPHLRRRWATAVRQQNRLRRGPAHSQTVLHRYWLSATM